MHTKATLQDLTVAQLTAVHNELSGKSVKKVKGSKDKIIGEILKMQPKAPKAKAPKAAGKKSTGGSIKDALRQMFSDGKARTEEQLVAAFPDRAWTSIRSMISDLKNPKYAGGDVFVIERDKETGKFQRVG